MEPAALGQLNTVCEVCGDVGFRHLLICCKDCTCSAVHQYCLDKVVFDASLAEWLCYECLQRRGEVTCSRTLEKASCQRLYSPNDGGEKLFSCTSVESTPTVQQGSADFVDTASSYQHGTTEPSESSKRYTKYQADGSCHHGKTVEMATTSSSYEESEEDIPSESASFESGDHQSPPAADFILSRTSYLSKTQKERVKAFIQQTKLDIPVFVAIMRKSNVQPPGPSLGISKEYAFAHFPHKSGNVTLQIPGKSKKWCPIFYKRNESRKNLLMGQWLHFVRDNHVKEGDICLIEPTKDGERSMFTVYLLNTTKTHSRDGVDFQRAGPCSGRSSAKSASVVRIEEEEPTNEEPLPLESMENENYFCPSQPPYIVPCRNSLSKSQKKIVEEKVRTIQSELPICVAVMKNNNVGVAQKWMLELGSRYASVHLPARGQTLVLQCRSKIWETKMVIHNGRRWFLNGGWPKFARDNDLHVGDICLFELKKNKKKLTMMVHIISREQF